ncbi:MAG: serpin family protein [Nocardioidaceae bacterium]
MATKQVKALTSLVGMGLVLSACGSAGRSPVAEHAQLLVANVTTVHPGAATPMPAFSAEMTQLGYEIGQRLHKTSADGNLVYSPASLAIACAMVREGARGTAAQQIDQVLHLPVNRSQAFNALLGSIKKPGSGNVLTVGDALFAKRGYPVHATFLHALKKWYGAGVYQTTFPNEGKAAVNAYVDKQTAGLIPHLITDEFNADTVMSLVDTLYLNARWQHRFDKNLTSPGRFTTSMGQVDVKMMDLMRDDMDYAAGPGWQAVRLPYQGGRLWMEVLLPDAVAQSPMGLLNRQTLAAAATRFDGSRVDLALPRWSFGTHASLKPMLTSMGMRAPFSPGGFPGITDDSRFRLDSVVQQAHISVGEKGTVAAAATQIEGIASAGAVDLKVVNVDHPFAYAVVDVTGVPLFEGTVGDPSAP